VVKSARMRWTRHVACINDRKSADEVFVERPESKRSLGRPRRRLEDNIKKDLQEVEWGHGLDLSGSGQGQVVDSCKRRSLLSVSIHCGEFLDLLRTFNFFRKDSAS
jgi:hypothetical protein